MKILVLILLVLAGIFLYQRAKSLATSERKGPAPELKPKPEAETTFDADAKPEAETKPEATVTPETSSEAALKADSKAAETDSKPVAEPAAEPAAVTEAEQAAESAAPKAESAAPNKESVAVADKPAPSQSAVEAQSKPEPVAESRVAAEQNTSSAPQSSSESKSSSELKSSSEPKPAAEQKAAPSIPAFASGALASALAAYHGADSAAARLVQLQAVIAECYRQRKDADHLSLGASLGDDAAKLLLELTGNGTELAKGVELKGALFMQLSTLLNDKGEFDAAIALCRQALALGLSDGTVTGFEGRISRIEKAKGKAGA
ncbi:hypothetical protein KJI95_12660 [Shewanella sp. JM162201]|uniref:Tetratricopeptide repeat protein n=1 Tax=Shewanella jiangmenensis TaxID=2837387 RepID=A0ABS5V4H9_9GAMM|nr:hypothetical protein [Shewanella jiangmenensis]MBT1445372.1 hypothetical protein [Shewanella jiangmenensis]